MATFTCKKCGTAKEKSCFRARRGGADPGPRARCLDCLGDNAPTHECRACRIEKPIAEFMFGDGTHRHRIRRCRDCWMAGSKAWKANNPEKVAVHKRSEYSRNREAYLSYSRSDGRKTRWFAWKLRTQFGITLDEFHALDSSQGYACAICRVLWSDISSSKHRRPHIDHCHKTGKVRGLLCNGCNIALGLFRDSHEVAFLAAVYLKAHNVNGERADGDRAKTEIGGGVLPLCRDEQREQFVLGSSAMVSRCSAGMRP